MATLPYPPLAFLFLLPLHASSLCRSSKRTTTSMGSNQLFGSLPAGLSSLALLTLLDVSSNYLTGPMVDRSSMPGGTRHDYSNNYMTGALLKAQCNSGDLQLGINCFSTAAAVSCAPQRPVAVCEAFCGLVVSSPTTPVCSGLGVCYLEGPSQVPTCLCLNGAVQDGRIYCAPPGSVGRKELVEPTFLTKGVVAATAGVFTADTLTLFSYRTVSTGCGTDLPFRVEFTFFMLPTSPTYKGANGLAFVISATNAAGTDGEGGGVGYAGMDARSIAVEFDTFTDAAHGDMQGDHVGINSRGSATSIKAVRSPFRLNNQKAYTAWIDYKPGSPGGPGTLSVYLAGDDVKPDVPLLESPLSLCDVLQPTPANRFFYFGFVASSVAPFQQQHAILVSFVETGLTLPTSRPVKEGNKLFTNLKENPSSLPVLLSPFSPPFLPPTPHPASSPSAWPTSQSLSLVFPLSCLPSLPLTMLHCSPLFHPSPPPLPLPPSPPSHTLPLSPPLPPLEAAYGLAVSAATFRPAKASPFTRYVSAAYSLTQSGQQDAWLLRDPSSWDVPWLAWPVKDQDACNACWAYAVVASIEAAYGIAEAKAAPQLSVESLFAAMGLTTQEGKCSAGGSPTDAFEKLLSLPKGGVALAVNATGTAVQRQPVVVHIEASAATFARYDGTYKYQDPACYTGELNHVVLVVGYSVAVGDSVQKRIPPPFWIIRNSWGAGWGYNGHMRMDIQGGDGVCGINVLPGIYPIVKIPGDPCGKKSFKVDRDGEPAFNPCGRFTCKALAKNKGNSCNKCIIPKSPIQPFVEVANGFGAKTCVYGERQVFAAPIDILPFEAPKKAPIDILPVLPSQLALLSCPPPTTGGTAAWTCRWSSHASTNLSLPFPDPLTLLSRPSSTARGTVAVDVCGSYFKNPCAVGTCINDGKGSYSCICPPNHVPSRTIDDFPTCDPAGSLATSLAVSGSNWACADVHPLMGLTLAQFTQQNGAINCNKPLLLNAVLQLGGSPVVPCTAFFYALSGDTCESIAWSIGRSESDLLELNPGLSCQQGIKAGRSLCVERNPEFAFKVPECLKFTTLTAQDSCERLLERTGGTTSVGASAWDELYRNNPGLGCSGTVPTAASAVGSSAGVQVCLKAEYWPFTLGRCTKGRAKTVSPSLSCSSAYSFYGGTMTAAAAKFTEYNGNACAKNVGAKYMCVPR
ncbi:unnamed protein product [Closterium sp. NIES-65]|nr:unnamed protein product [Closterium sp. NIES-65]